MNNGQLMERTSSLTEQLAAAMQCRLSQPPTRAGMRLKTMRELARMVGLSHESVNQSLDGLVARGVLARRRGSGVYVRKVPRANGLKLDPRWENKLRDIFAEDPVPTRRRPEPEHARFHLDLWWNADPLGVSGGLIQRGMRDQARELGHRFRSAALDEQGDGPVSRDKSGGACDGHIVWLPIAETFERRVGTRGLPTVYLWCDNAESALQPIIEIDMAEALVRAVRLLAVEGYERIAFLGWKENAARLQPLYDATLQQAGRTYRAAEFSDALEADDVAAVRRLFARAEAPQAVYVADDMMMRHVLPVLRELGREPGRNLGLITQANRGHALPSGLNWSRMEFDPYAIGRLAVQSLVREIESAGDELLSFAHRAAWKPGDTHRLKAG